MFCTNWEELTDLNLERFEDVSKEILKIFHNNRKDFFDKTRDERTSFIKKELANLGHSLAYKVYANKLNKKDYKDVNKRLDELIEDGKIPDTGGKFINQEWLFDLQWYTEPIDTNYLTEEVPLVMECEWDYKRKEDNDDTYGALKFDFQKLIIANAELRLMIFKLRQDTDIHEDLDRLKIYFNNALKYYKRLEENSTILIVGVYESKRRNEQKFYILNCKK